MPSNEELLAAVHRATRKLASIGDFDEVLRDVLAICVEAADATGGTIYLHDKANKLLRFHHVLPEELVDRLKGFVLPDDFGVVGRVYQTRQADISDFDPNDPKRQEIDAKIGVRVRNMITVPLMFENEEPIGVVQLLNKRNGVFSEHDRQVLDTVSAVSTLAYLNSQLLEEQTRSSQLLGMGKVGHDIKNMAASESAILYVFEPTLDMLSDHLRSNSDEEGMLLLESVNELVSDLRQNNERILGFTTLISDLSVGKELAPQKKFEPMGPTIENSAAYLASEAKRKGVVLTTDIQADAPPFPHDPIYVQRIVQNLVGNAIKAVVECAPNELRDRIGKPNSDDDVELGKVHVSYHFKDGSHILEVTDSGAGMDEETKLRILGGQGRSGWQSSGGSGWGTKIVLELSHTHNGILGIDTELGCGSTFRISFRPDA
ncbi:MAG: hypothetical protein HONBIEJF_00006 [Fimbriimonadaceae bacterium]|nr:hypothetical protein [Fimbriimonadaceae bacterium]